LNAISNHYDIKKARALADYVIVICHGGREHYQLPSPQLRERYKFFIDSGADAVISHHTHCFSGYEYHNGKPIFYSLGNFIFDYKKKYQKGLWTQGFAVLLKFSDDLIDFELIPFHQGREKNPNLTLLDEVERKIFDDKIEELNTIINDENLFLAKWNEYIKSQMLSYNGLLLIQNKYLRALKSKGLLPRFFMHSEKHQYVLLNLMKCEAHREIMINVLEKKLK
jgi:poly-gamma-glutamate synthesis protein (capsule biosynthesis protein)